MLGLYNERKEKEPSNFYAQMDMETDRHVTHSYIQLHDITQIQKSEQDENQDIVSKSFTD